MEEICEKLQSNERRPKISALEDLQRQCQNTKHSSAEILAIFDECYLHLLKCYSDRYESVRDQTAHTVTVFIERLPPNDFHLQNIIATLSERMGQQETLEESEEIRLLFVLQLHALVRQYTSTGNGHSLQECYPDIVRVLAKALRDPYPAVQREACACVVSLARPAETINFQQWAEPLAKSLYGMLNHKHSQARIAAVAALGQIALHINASDDALSRLIMEVSPLLMDSMALVRRQCGQLGVLMLLELRDRYSFFDRIIPLVLCCLKDDSPEVQDFIRPLWVQCGKLYYEENEAELNKQELADPAPENYPSGVQRPTTGCRGLVQRSLRLLKLITREAGDWKENVRLHSLKLLYQFVLHAEAAMTAKFFEIYPDVARSCNDSESVVANEALKVADLMGRLLSYDDWHEHGFDGLAKHAKEGYLKCFYYMFTACNAATFDDILRVSKLLINSEYSQTLKPAFQLYVIKMVETLLEKSEKFKQNQNSIESSIDQLQLHDCDAYEELDKNAYIATIKIMSLSLDTDQSNAAELQKKGNAILERISQRQQITLGELHEKCFPFALEYVENLDAPLDGLSEPILLLHGLLSICKFRKAYLESLQTKINTVCGNCADDAKVKVFSAVSIAMLHWHETMAQEVSESTQLLQAFVISVVEPHLLWRAGANAEAMRSLATATLCSMSQGAREEATQVLPSVAAKYMTSLLEDRSISTRHYAIKCLFNFGEIAIEDMRLIAYSTLQRLDDPSAGIRELAVSAIPKLSPKFEKEKCDDVIDHEHDIWGAFIKKTLDMFFLHYGGPQVRLNAAIKDSILVLAEKYPEICKDSFKRTLSVSYGGGSLLELQNELPFSIE